MEKEITLSLESMQRTYTGLLDDVMIRYSDRFLSKDFFNKMIAKNIFFGGGLYINDGYLVNHPIAREYLFSDSSLLRRMLATGFIRILTRAPSGEILADMPERMARQGNESFRQLVNSTEWSEFAPVFRRIAQAAFFNNTARSWPNRDMSVGFTKLMRDRAFAEEDPNKLGLVHIVRDEWLRIRDDFLSREPEKSGARDKLEKAAIQVLGESRSSPLASINDVMTIGNQAYHYNFGLALTYEEENGVAVDTTVGAAFDELLQTRQIERGQLDRIPILRLPKNLPFDRGDLFLDFLDQSTLVGEAKLNYITSLRNIISATSTNFDALRIELMDRTDEYINRIIELLSPTFGRFDIEKVFDESFTLAIGNIESDSSDERVTATAAPTAGLAIEIQDTASRRGRQFLIERFNLTDVSQEFDPDDQTITLGDIRPQIASLAFDEEEAERFISDVPVGPIFN